jgi:hypothetical protein
MRKDIDDLDPHEYYNEPELAVDLEVPLDLDASLDPEASLDCPSVADGSNSDATPAGPRAADPPEEEVKMRDFSIVQSSRYVSALPPGRRRLCSRLTMGSTPGREQCCFSDRDAS